MIDTHSPEGLADAGTDAVTGVGDGVPQPRVGLAQVRAVLASTAELLRALPGALWQAGGSELGVVLGELDQLVAVAAAGRVAVTAEAVQRGEVASSQCAGTAAWVTEHAPALAAAGGSGQLGRLVEQIDKPRLRPVRDAVLAGELSVPVALVVVGEFDKLRGRIIPEAQPLVLEGLVRIGVEDGAKEVRRLRPRLLADHGAPGELQDEQDKAAEQVALSHPRCVDDGVWDYLFRVDAEGKAILEAAIGPLSAPVHRDGARDPRSAQQRRGQALLEVCRRVTAAAKAAGRFGGYPDPTGDAGGTARPTSSRTAGDAVAHPGKSETAGTDSHGDGSGTVQPPDAHARDGSATSWPEGHPEQHTTRWNEQAGPDEDAVDPIDAQTMQTMLAVLAGMGAGGAKASLLLTMNLTDLTKRVGAATTLGSLDAGTLLAPETARRIACDAGVIPVLLGSNSAVLDVGRTQRLFTPGQARAVLLRDRHCTFPRCDIPAFWTQLHHVVHWLDGGLTDVANAAMLCARHHTIVHRDRLSATVHPTGVEWDTAPGSYDRVLARERSRDRDRDYSDHPAA